MTLFALAFRIVSALNACGPGATGMPDDVDDGDVAFCVEAQLDSSERFPEVAPQGASGMLRVDTDADDDCAQY